LICFIDVFIKYFIKFLLDFYLFFLIDWEESNLTDVDIKIENIVASAAIGKDIELTEVSKALEGVDFNREQFPGLVFKLKEPKTAALIFSSGKLVCTGAKSIESSIVAINKTVDLMRTVDKDIPHEFEIKIQNIVASANLEATLNLEAVALELENTEYEPEQFPGLVYRLKDPKVVLLLFGSGKVVCTGAKTKDDAKLGVERAYDRLSELDLL
jgi:transcription initiation factor TFIID TATA-box-binding protein